MKLILMRAGFLIGCWLVVSQILRAECKPSPWQPVFVKSAICGRAMDISRNPLENAEIELRDATNKVVATSRTNMMGDFKFSPVPEGIYSFHVAGFHIPHGAVRVTGRQTRCGPPVTVTFELGLDPCNSAVAFEGTLQLVANVRYARISIDGEDSTGIDLSDDDDRSFDLDAGIHRVLIDGAPGYEPLSFRVRIRAGQTTTYRVELHRQRR